MVTPGGKAWAAKAATSSPRRSAPIQVLRRLRRDPDRVQSAPGSAAESWGRFYAALANESRSLLGIADSPTAELKERGLAGERLQKAIRKESARRKNSLAPTETWLEKWRQLRGEIDDGLPDAAILTMVDRHRRYVRRIAADLVGRTGGELEDLFLADRAYQATVTTAVSTDHLATGRLPMGHWELLVMGMKSLREPGSAARPETNLLFLALALPDRVLFRRCARDGCESLFFVENKAARCCSPACRTACWLSKPKTKNRVQNQTNLRVQRHRAMKRLLKGDNE